MGLFTIGRWGRTCKTLMSAVGLSSALLVAAGCQNASHDEKRALHQENRELRARLDERDAMKSQEAPITPPAAPEPQPQAITPSPAPSPSPAPAAMPDLGGDVTVDAAAGTTTVNFLGDTLFDSGQATLKPSAKASLDKMVAGLKKQYAGKPVKVQGHSDSDPIRRSKWSSNQALSEARAKAVSDYLVQKGVEASRINTEGFGSEKPKSPNDKSKNRRVEIVVMTR